MFRAIWRWVARSSNLSRVLIKAYEVSKGGVEEMTRKAPRIRG